MIRTISESRVRALVWLALIALSLYFAIMLVRYPPGFIGVDLAVWQHDWKSLQCQLSASTCEGLSKFPFAYLGMSGLLEGMRPLTAAVLASLSGVAHPLAGAALGISILNLLFLLFPVGFFWCVDRPTWRWRSIIYALTISASPLLPFYVVSGGLELQSGVLLGICIACAQRIVNFNDKRLRLISLLFITLLLTPLYKDTNLLVIGVVLLLLIIEFRRNARIPLVALLVNMRWPLSVVIGAVFISLATIFAYNYQKYSSILPLEYIYEAEHSRPSIQLVFWNLLAVLFSANGGALIFWTFPLAILFCCAWLFRVRTSAMALRLCATIFGLSVLICANWSSPFGWDGWGNRLLVPGMLAAIIVLVSALEIRAAPVVATCSAESSVKNLARVLGVFSLLFVLIVSAAYVLISYSGRRSAYLHESLTGPESCKLMYEGRGSMGDCHTDRFLLLPALSVLVKRPPPLLMLGSITDIARDKPSDLLRSGWSDIESWGVWSSDHKAKLAFVPAAPLKKVLLTLMPLTAPTLKAQRVRVYLNGRFVTESNLAQTSILEIPVGNSAEYSGSKVLELELELPDAAKPFHLGINQDQRTLGVGLKSLEVR